MFRKYVTSPKFDSFARNVVGNIFRDIETNLRYMAALSDVTMSNFSDPMLCYLEISFRQIK